MSAPHRPDVAIPEIRRGRARRLPALLAIAALLCAPASSQATAGEKVYDAVVIRPLAAIHTLAGAIVFVPVALMALPGGTTREALNTFVLVPFNDLYERPLGEF